MANCSFCGKKVNRRVFCSPSHKVMYHRRKLTKSKQTTASLPEVNIVIDKSAPPMEEWKPAANLSKAFFTGKGKGRK